MGTFSRPLVQRAARWVQARTGRENRSPGSDSGLPAIGARYAQEGPVCRASRVVPRSSRFVFAIFAEAKRFSFPRKHMEAKVLGARGGCMIGAENSGAGGRLLSGCVGCFANLLDSRKARRADVRLRARRKGRCPFTLPGVLPLDPARGLAP